MKACVISLVLLFFSFSCPHLGCNTTEPPPVSTVRLSVEDAGVTEGWLKVSLTDASEPRTVALKRDGQTVQTLRISSLDSIVVDTALLPHRSYSYKAYRITDSRLIDSSTQLTLTTMDTTSHNFTWEIGTLGDGSSSVLYDVAIINDTLAFAVGEVFLTGDPRRYNLAIWNGTSWRIERLTYQGSPPVIRSIFAVASNDVWLDPWFHWNGQTFQEVPVNPIFIGVGVNKMWGNPAGELYAVGNGGFIACSSNRGNTWQRVESGTTIDLRDVWGSSDAGSVWTCGYRNDYSVSVLLQYTGQQWRQVIEVPTSSPPRQDTLSGSIASIWRSAARGATAATSGGIYRVPFTSHGEARRTWYPNVAEVGFFHRVRGSELNNMFVVGAFGTVAHFNGAHWKVFPQFQASGRLFFSTSVTAQYVMICGYDGARAIIIGGTTQ